MSLDIIYCLQLFEIVFINTCIFFVINFLCCKTVTVFFLNEAVIKFEKCSFIFKDVEGQWRPAVYYRNKSWIIIDQRSKHHLVVKHKTVTECNFQRLSYDEYNHSLRFWNNNNKTIMLLWKFIPSNESFIFTIFS